MVGSVLPGAVRDHAGRILIQSGETLSAAHLHQLDQGGACALYAGADWGAPPERRESVPQTLRAKEVVHALLRRHRTVADDGRTRRQRRHEWRVRLRMAIQECSEELIHRREIEIEIETCDLSASGFAFVSQQFLHVGTLVYPRFVTLPNRPVLKGIVRNCRHIEGRRHRVGVEFLQPESDEPAPSP